MNPTKVFEIKPENWIKGISIQPDFPVGGFFQSALNFNPFERIGYFQATLAPTIIDASTITTQVDYIVSESDGYAYLLGDRSGTGTKCLYRVNLANNTVTDYSATIDQNATTGAVTHSGVTIYGNNADNVTRLVYEQGGSIRTNSIITPTIGNDKNVLTSALTSTLIPIDFCEGTDGNLYYTANNGGKIGKIITTESTSGNSSAAFVLARGQQPRSVCRANDSYLAITSDNNDSKLITPTATCKVYFWDQVKSTADVIWDIPDSYLIGGRYINGGLYVIGYSGLWLCSFSTAPKLIFPFTSAMLPSGINQITVYKNILYWAASAIGGRVWAFGALVGKPIVYNPYQTTSGSDTHTGLCTVSDQLLAATTTQVVLHNYGSTRAGSTIQNATQNLDAPFTFSYAKVVLKDPLSSGQSVALSVYDSNSRVLLDTTTKTFTTFGAKKDLVFKPTGSSGGVKRFDDIYISLTVTGGCAVKRVAIYGTPVGDDSETL